MAKQLNNFYHKLKSQPDQIFYYYLPKGLLSLDGYNEYVDSDIVGNFDTMPGCYSSMYLPMKLRSINGWTITEEEMEGLLSEGRIEENWNGSFMLLESYVDDYSLKKQVQITVLIVIDNVDNPIDVKEYICWKFSETNEIPIADWNNVGLVKPDGTTITISSDGTIQSVIPKATASTFGAVKIDNNTIKINNGAIFANSPIFIENGEFTDNIQMLMPENTIYCVIEEV